MQITEETAKVLAVAGKIAEEKHASLIRDTFCSAVHC